MGYTEKIKRFMEIKGLNNRDLSKKIQKPEALVSRWINSDKPSLEFLTKMLHTFPDFDLNYVLREKSSYSNEEQDYIVSDNSEEYASKKDESIEDIIVSIQDKLDELKEKVAQNSHK